MFRQVSMTLTIGCVNVFSDASGKVSSRTKFYLTRFKLMNLYFV